MKSLACSLMFAAAFLYAADKPGDPKAVPQLRYDPTTASDFKATITEVREVSKTGSMDGLYLTVKAETGTFKTQTFDVYVGPTDFLKQFEVTFAKGDKIPVTGSKVQFEGVEMVLAREITRDQTTVILRDKAGEPFWKPSGKPPTD